MSNNLVLVIGFAVTVLVIALIFIWSDHDHRRQLRKHNEAHARRLRTHNEQMAEIYRKHRESV